MLERTDCGLGARIDAMADGTALHEDDGMMAVLARDSGRKAHHEPCFGLPRHLLEAAR